MADSYSQIYIQLVFVVKRRQRLITPDWEEKLHKYITGIVTNKGQKMLAINGMPDHLHFFIGMKPSCCLSDLVREIKKSSTEFVKQNRYSKFPFQWQEGYGAFSYSRSSIPNVIAYIENQKRHHAKQSFEAEYRDFLKMFNVHFKEEYFLKE